MSETPHWKIGDRASYRGSAATIVQISECGRYCKLHRDYRHRENYARVAELSKPANPTRDYYGH